MYLFTDWDKPRIVEEDIICYKWYIVKEYNHQIVSPYRGKLIPKFNTVTCTVLDDPKEFNDIFGICWKVFNKNLIYSISRGFHSFATFEDAITDSYKGFNQIIVSCTIPKGAKYYKGVYGNNAVECYCSDRIILNNFII